MSFCIYIHIHFFINLIVKSIETFVVCAVSRIKLLLLLLGQSTYSIPRLNRDDFGVVAFPTIHAVGKVIEPPQSERSKRKVT